MSYYFVGPWTAARRLLCPWDFPGNNTGVGCHFLLQRIFLIQGSKRVNCIGRWFLYLCHQGCPHGVNEKKVKVKSFNCVWLFATPWTVAHQAPSSMEFSRQGYWSGLPFPSPGDLPDRGIDPGSPTLQANAFTVSATRVAQVYTIYLISGGGKIHGFS